MVAVLLVVVGPVRPLPTTLLLPRSNSKPEAATAVDKLLMMGMRMPETCWAVFKRQVINLKDWCFSLVDLYEYKLDTCFSFCEHPTSDAFIKILSEPFSHAYPAKLLQAFWTLSATKNCLMTSKWWVGILHITPNMSSCFPSLTYIHKNFSSNSFNVKIKSAMSHSGIYLTT